MLTRRRGAVFWLVVVAAVVGVVLLTDVGRKALATVTDRRRELVAETIADWPDADVDTLVALLERLTERFEFSVGR